MSFVRATIGESGLKPSPPGGRQVGERRDQGGLWLKLWTVGADGAAGRNCRGLDGAGGKFEPPIEKFEKECEEPHLLEELPTGPMEPRERRVEGRDIVADLGGGRRE